MYLYNLVVICLFDDQGLFVYHLGGLIQRQSQIINKIFVIDQFWEDILNHLYSGIFELAQEFQKQIHHSCIIRFHCNMQWRLFLLILIEKLL
jgi:hypothetical protein